MKKFLLIIVVFFVTTFFLVSWVFSNFLQKEEPQVQIVKAPETKITFIEGWTLEDIAQYLNEDKRRTEQPHIVNEKEFLAEAKEFDTNSYTLLASKPQSAGLEGFIFPDTYLIPQTAPSSTTISKIIIKKALDNFNKKFTPAMREKAETSGLSVYELVTLASIVEKETGRNAVTKEQKEMLDEERKIVAGIFYNRLNARMALASDATINYITKKNDPAVSQADLDIDSPYNTYKYAGLPPGPICNPSLSSLLAVLEPSKTDYYYFLHKQPSGEVVYSRTFEEHVQNKNLYLK